MIDDVRVALTALRAGGAATEGDLRVIPLPGMGQAMLGLDGRGRPHLLLPTAADGEPPMTDIVTLEVSSRSLAVGGATGSYLDVACLLESVAEVFEHFVVAVCEGVIGSGEDARVVLMKVLENWRQFLTPAQSAPSREKLAAVLAELLVVRDLAALSPSAALAAWVGPHGGRHDFRQGQEALEVKNTRSHTARRVTIHGEDQLEPPADGGLHLHLVRLEEAAGAGQSVASAVDQVLAAGVPAEPLFDALSAGGLPVAELGATADIRFDVRERLTVPVDDVTPRIVPSSFVGGARPTGVIDLTYVIDLDHTLDRALDDRAYNALLSRLVAPVS